MEGFSNNSAWKGFLCVLSVFWMPTSPPSLYIPHLHFFYQAPLKAALTQLHDGSLTGAQAFFLSKGIGQTLLLNLMPNVVDAAGCWELSIDCFSGNFLLAEKLPYSDDASATGTSGILGCLIWGYSVLPPSLKWEQCHWDVGASHPPRASDVTVLHFSFSLYSVLLPLLLHRCCSLW